MYFTNLKNVTNDKLFSLYFLRQLGIIYFAHHHVSVPDRLHFVHVVIFYRRVEAGVQIVEKVYHLYIGTKKKFEIRIIVRVKVKLLYCKSIVSFGRIGGGITCRGVLSADMAVNPTMSLK